MVDSEMISSESKRQYRAILLTMLLYEQPGGEHWIATKRLHFYLRTSQNLANYENMEED